MNSKRPYDIIVYSATGFTGTLIAEYFAKNVNQQAIRWALAARNQNKLEALKTRLLGLVDKHPSLQIIDTFLSDVNNSDSVDEICAKTKVIISAVGPYVVYGEAVVKSCVANKTDYVDVTGEPGFVRQMIEKYHVEATENNTMIVHCCGVDSIPADMGTLFAATALKEKIGHEEPINVEAFINLDTPSPLDSMSNGTWTTLVHSFANMSRNSALKSKQRVSIPKKRSAKEKLVVKPHYSTKLKGWVMPFPVADPFVVKRSSHLAAQYYGDMEYGHYVLFYSLLYYILFIIFFAFTALMSQFGITRSLLFKLKSDGDGPSLATRQSETFNMTFYATPASKSHPCKGVKCRVVGGEVYTETAKMVTISALCVLQDKSKFEIQGGVLTPAAAMGDHLLGRLQALGLSFSVVRD